MWVLVGLRPKSYIAGNVKLIKTAIHRICYIDEVHIPKERLCIRWTITTYYKSSTKGRNIEVNQNSLSWDIWYWCLLLWSICTNKFDLANSCTSLVFLTDHKPVTMKQEETVLGSIYLKSSHIIHLRNKSNEGVPHSEKITPLYIRKITLVYHMSLVPEKRQQSSSVKTAKCWLRHRAKWAICSESAPTQIVCLIPLHFSSIQSEL